MTGDRARAARAASPLVVAIDAPSVDLTDRDRLASAFPSVSFVAATDPDDLAQAITRAHVVFGKRLPHAAIAGAPTLAWVQAGTAGVDGVLARGPWPDGVLLTNARGAHGTPISEQVVAMMLAFATRLHVLLRAQAERRNVARAVTSTKWELSGQRLVILGLGDIGGSLAVRASALGMRVTGVRREPAPVPGCERVVGPGSLVEVLRDADHLAACLPLTPGTRHLVGEAELRALPRGAHVYNVGRGAVIDGQALRRALADGHLGGAGLDCVEPSDIPDVSDPLWSHPDVILGQHSSGHAPGNSRLITDIFASNLERFLAGRELENRVDLARGY